RHRYALHKALYHNRSDTGLGLGAARGYNSVWSIDRDFHASRGVNDGFAFLKIAADQPIAESQRQFGPRNKFYASQIAKIDNRAVSLRAIDRDLAIVEYRRARNRLISVNRNRAVCYQLTV